MTIPPVKAFCLKLANKAERAKSLIENSRRLNAGLVAIVVAIAAAMPVAALAHPHVFVEANLEVVRNEVGEATQIRQVWRFDELFSSTVLLDFDANGNNTLDQGELAAVAGAVKQSIAEYNFYTEIRNGDAVVHFYEPEPFVVDYDNGQVIMIMAMELEKPESMASQGFRVAVSDPTYYVAMEFIGRSAIKVSGNGDGCKWDITRPDWDALYAKDAKRLAELFAAEADEEVEASDEYLTWIGFTCG